jgi:predicted nucleic acid-binding protein
MEAEEMRFFGNLPSNLHKGEASCLAIAKHRGWQFLTDDQAARRASARFSIPLSGSIGCLALTVEHSILELDEANVLLDEWIKLGFRSPVSDLTPLIVN